MITAALVIGGFVLGFVLGFACAPGFVRWVLSDGGGVTLPW